MNPSRLETKHRRLDLARNKYQAFEAAAASGDLVAAWRALELAHVLTQPYVWPHIQNHFVMFRYAWTTRNWPEWRAQIPRLLLAGPGSLTGRAPRGNPGTRRVGIFESADPPAELTSVLDANGSTN